MPAPQQGGQGDNSAGILWGVAALFAILAGIWFAFKSYIIHFYLVVKLYETNLLGLVLGQKVDAVRNVILSAMGNPKSVSFDGIIQIGTQVGSYLRYPFCILLILCAAIIYFGHSTRVFKRAYSMKDLSTLEKNNWPQITPVIGKDLLKTDIHKGPWAMAMNPIQFCKRFKLIEEVKLQRREGMTRRDLERRDVVLKRGDANRLFALQLGPLWKGSDKLPKHTRALFAAFAARINADSKSAAQILAQLSATCTGTMNFSGVDELLKKHENTKPVQQIINSHAYVLTVMAAMLEGARDDGVQASADFLWLKPLDRRLWYTLNTVGRQTPFIEVAGIFAHWVAEKEAGRKLLVPMIEEATKAVELALTEVIYKPDE